MISKLQNLKKVEATRQDKCYTVLIRQNTANSLAMWFFTVYKLSSVLAHKYSNVKMNDRCNSISVNV